MSFLDKLKDQCTDRAVEYTLEKKVDELREKEGDSPVGKVLGFLDSSGVEVKDCMDFAGKMGFDVKDVTGAAEKAGLSTTDCIKLISGAQKDDKGDVFDTLKDVIGGSEQEKGGFNIGNFLGQKND